MKKLTKHSPFISQADGFCPLIALGKRNQPTNYSRSDKHTVDWRMVLVCKIYVFGFIFPLLKLAKHLLEEEMLKHKGILWPCLHSCRVVDDL